MELHEALLAVKYDKRLLDWHLKQGLISEAEFNKHLSTLPDVTAQSTKLDFAMDGSDSDDTDAIDQQQ